LRPLKKYGMILVGNGSSWYLSGAPDARWDNVLHQITQLHGSDFEGWTNRPSWCSRIRRRVNQKARILKLRRYHLQPVFRTDHDVVNPQPAISRQIIRIERLGHRLLPPGPPFLPQVPEKIHLTAGLPVHVNRAKGFGPKDPRCQILTGIGEQEDRARRSCI